MPVPGAQANGVFLLARPVLTPRASSTCEWMSWPRLSSGPNFSPSPYTPSPEASANAAVHTPPRTPRPKQGSRVHPPGCWSVNDVNTGAPFHSRRMRSGDAAISSVASPSANVHTPGSDCVVVQARARPVSRP